MQLYLEAARSFLCSRHQNFLIIMIQPRVWIQSFSNLTTSLPPEFFLDGCKVFSVSSEAGQDGFLGAFLWFRGHRVIVFTPENITCFDSSASFFPYWVWRDDGSMSEQQSANSGWVHSISPLLSPASSLLCPFFFFCSPCLWAPAKAVSSDKSLPRCFSLLCLPSYLVFFTPTSSFSSSPPRPFLSCFLLSVSRPRDCSVD